MTHDVKIKMAKEANPALTDHAAAEEETERDGGMNAELFDAYRNTNYLVSEQNIVIRIGQICKELNQLLSAHNLKSWAFITPYNPRSEILSDQENEARFELFRKEMRDYATFEGEGVGLDKKWPAEKSLLILGIERGKAVSIGRKFEQNAIVCGGVDEPAELVILQ